MHDIHEPINISVEPNIRAILRTVKGTGEPLEVADIQEVMRAVGGRFRKLKSEIFILNGKVRKQKHKLTEYQKIISLQNKLLIKYSIDTEIEKEV